MTLFDSQLPEGWTWQRLGNRYDVTKKPRGLEIMPEAMVPFLPMDGVPAQGREQPKWELRPYHAITSGVYFNRDDLLLSRITPSFENGKQALATDLPADGGYGSTELIPIHSRMPDADLRFLFYYLLHPDVRAHLVSRMEGATGRQRVPDAAVLETPVPRPPYKEQLRISATLRLAQQGIEAEERVLATLREIKDSAMHHLFTRGLKGEPQKESEIGLIPNSWTVQPLSAFGRLSSGGTPSRGDSLSWLGGSVPWVKTGEIDYVVITHTDECITQHGLETSAAKLLPRGTLLVAMYGQGITRGKVALLGIEAATNQACAALPPMDDGKANGYLFYYLTYSYERLRQRSHGAQQANLNLQAVASFDCAVPNDDGERNEITHILTVVDRAIDSHTRKRDCLEKLFQTLLHELTTGRIRVADLDLPMPVTSGLLQEATGAA
jgi:type I restriction enzyme S subunit